MDYFFHKSVWYSEWNYTILSANPNTTMKIVLENPDKDWSYYYLSKNPSITFKDVLENPDKKWNYCMLSLYMNVTFIDFLDHPEFPWDYTSLSGNERFVQSYIDIVQEVKKTVHKININDDIVSVVCGYCGLADL